jgi:hypothetical protein
MGARDPGLYGVREFRESASLMIAANFLGQ